MHSKMTSVGLVLPSPSFHCTSDSLSVEGKGGEEKGEEKREREGGEGKDGEEKGEEKERALRASGKERERKEGEEESKSGQG